MEIRISVLASGEILLDGKAAQLSTVRDVLERAESKEDCVLYYRESTGAEPPPQALDIMSLVATQKLPISLSSKPDFSDYVDQFCQSHPRSLQGERPSRDPFEPRMPEVDLRRRAEDVFVEVRRYASREAGGGGVVLVKPDRALLMLPMPVAPKTPELSHQLPAIIPMDRSCNIAVISDTRFTMSRAGAVPGIEDAGRAIPFLGFLIGWSQAGHQVWVFEGHPSALAAGLTDSEFLLLDSAMLPFLQSDWMSVTKATMKPGGKVFLHDRVKYQLFPLVASDRPPGWRLSEPDGEASYANCLLTTLAKGKAESVTIVSGSPVPDLAGLTTDPEELDWIAGLLFRYDVLDAQKVIRVLLNAAGKGKVGAFQKEWLLTTKLVSRKEEPKIQTFVFRRERNWLKTVLHVSKL